MKILILYLSDSFVLHHVLIKHFGAVTLLSFLLTNYVKRWNQTIVQVFDCLLLMLIAALEH